MRGFCDFVYLIYVDSACLLLRTSQIAYFPHVSAQEISKLSTKKHIFTCVGSDVLTVMIMITIFKNVTPCSPVKFD
jgi:hypothetical protein